MRRTSARARLISISCLHLVVAVSLAAPASAGLFVGSSSPLRLKIGALPGIEVLPTGLVPVSVLPGTPHGISAAAGVWNFAGVAAPTTPFTGIPLISGLTLTASFGAVSLTNGFSTPNALGTALPPPSATVCPGSCVGGPWPITGQMVLQVAGFPLTIPLSVVGQGGVTSVSLGTATVKMTGMPFATGQFHVTGIKTNVVRTFPGMLDRVQGTITELPPPMFKTLTTGNGFVSTQPSAPVQTRTHVTISGFDNITSAGLGTAKFVTPIRIDSNVLPLFAESQSSLGPLDRTLGVLSMKVTFVPEPGLGALLGAGAVGLWALGGRQRRRLR